MTNPAIGLTPASLNFTATIDGTNPPDQTLNIANTNINGSDLFWSASDNADWLTLSSASGTAPSIITISADIKNLAVGIHDATITITDQNATNIQQTVPVTLTIETKPDLIISALTTPASVPTEGAAISVTDTNKNQGGSTAGTSATKYFLSANATYEPTDTLLGSRQVSALPALGTDTKTVSLKIPATPASKQYIIAKADANNAVTESDENNNTKSSPISITGSDLTVSIMTSPASSGTGKSISVSHTVKNQAATGTAGGSTSKIYLSANNTLDPADTLLGSKPIPILAAGAISKVTASVTIPLNIPAKKYYIIIMADADLAVPETIEGNNTNNKAISISAPDLTVSAITIPTTVNTDTAFPIKSTTKNKGKGNAGISTTSFYLSLNSTYEAGDILLGSKAMPSLLAGGSKTGSVSVKIPAGTAPKQYYIIAVSDSGKVIIESNETNNNMSKLITVK